MPRRPFPIVISGPHGDKTGHAMRGQQGQKAAGCGFGGRRFRGKRCKQGVCPATGGDATVRVINAVSVPIGDRAPVMGVAEGSRPWEWAKESGYGRAGARGAVFRIDIRQRIAVESADCRRSRIGGRHASGPAPRPIGDHRVSANPVAIACPAPAPDRRGSRNRPSPAPPARRVRPAAKASAKRAASPARWLIAPRHFERHRPPRYPARAAEAMPAHSRATHNLM